MSMTVLDAGALTTIQDHGRPGHAHLGVPRAGALDAPAAALAQRLVGNPSSHAVLESTLTGVTVRVERAATIAVTGARCEVYVDARPAAFGEPISVRAGAVVTVGRALSGVRSYLAVGGGIDVAPVLGSRSTDTLAWVGPPRVVAGAVLPLGAPTRPQPVDVVAPPPRTSWLRVVPGPRAEWLDDRGWSALERGHFTVEPSSNRVGLRLGGGSLTRARDGEIASEGMVLGAVQLPPSGQPVIFLADHPVTGGYPVVGVVEAADLAACAQLRPGDGVELRVVQSGSDRVAGDSAGSSTR